MATRPKQTKRPRSESAPTSTRRDLVIDEILETAVKIFADQGFQGTGIQDIADAMNMSRPAIYHYFGSKEELLEALAADVAVEHVKFIREIHLDPKLDGPTKLRQVVSGLVSRTAAKPAHMRLLAADESSFPSRIGAVHAAARHEALELVEALIEDGVAAGELRPVNSRIAALALFGMCNWVAWWFHPDGPASADEIAREMEELIVDGLVRPPQRRRERGTAQALALVREDLDYLERIMLNDKG
jgi:AcrR family transcriptional regulator